jgi:two-component system chemotaxis sensor kinase CheA
MPTPDEEFLQRLQATFKVEAEEHLQAISSLLLELEKSPPPAQQAAAVEGIFRESHSLKGAARAVDLADIEAICQALESVFSGWKKQQTTGSPEAFDTLHRAVDMIRALVSAPDMGQGSGPPGPRDDLIRQLGQLESRRPAPPRRRASVARTSVPEMPTLSERSESKGPGADERSDAKTPPGRSISAQPEIAPREEPAHAKPDKILPVQSAPAHFAEPERTAIADTVRISIAKLDSQLLQAEDMLAVKTMTGQRAVELRQLASRFEAWRKQWAGISTDVRTMRQTLEKEAKNANAAQSTSAATSAPLLEFLDWNFDYLRSLESRLTSLAEQAEQDRHGVAMRVDDLLADSKKLLMLPFSTLAGMFPKLVRDLCRDQGKEADLVIRGGDVEVDKRILEEMKDALVHILRNCVDHGVEKPQERARLNKPPRATITLSASQANGNKVEILVADDGGGIDLERVKESAVRSGVLADSAARALDDAETMALIFQSGVTTSPIITEISGRGLGMAIARANTEKLGGRIAIESKPAVGTTLRMMLPVTLATFRGILIAAAGRTFVVPTLNVDRVLRVKPGDIQSVENRETMSLQGRPVSLARLEAVLQLPPGPRRGDGTAPLPVVVLHSADQQIAFVVDEVLHEEEVLVKPLGKPLVRVRNVAGAAVLGSGKAVPILNVSDLIKSARTHSPGAPGAAPEKGTKASAKRVLVVEDSITSRMLLKGILEAAGYQVKTAVDGVDGFTALREDRFDLVVSDVEMPRMTGFDLTARIRADKRLAETPVVLVTALESREQRERGIDAGANAYITKSSFDQRNLLEVIRKLV